MPGQDVCFNSSSYTVVVAVGTTLVGTISTLFGMLVLSMRAQVKAAEVREQAAAHDLKEAYKQRNDALTRAEEARTQYRSFVQEQRALGTGGS